MASFRGYFLPEKRDSNEDGEDSEVESESDNEDFENPDYHDIINTTSGRYKFYSASRTRYVTEKLRELKELDGRLQSKGEKLVRARFDRMFTHPWWMAEMILKGSSQTQKSIPSYSIRSDDGVDKFLISLFLTQGCRVQQQHAVAILDFIENRNLRTTFDCLLENITEFERSSDISNDIAKQIRKSLTSTATGKAFLVPELTKIAHRLFPRHTDALFSSTSLEVLTCIEQAVRNEPWILGYQKVLQGKFGISGCEAKLAAFVDCGLLTTMPVVKRDALYIYNALCKLTHKEGHTFVPLSLLKGGKWYNKPVAPGPYQVTKWDESLTYLLEIHAVGISGNTFEDECSVFLPHIHGYEKSIVRDICSIRSGMPWVNYMEIDEKLFNGDQDQIRAARLITQKPVVVLSGRGGCGKTHVVSTVLSKVLELEESQMSGDHGCDQQETSEKLQPTMSILLTAPTGRAASILGKQTGIEAYTLHSVISSYFHWLKEVKEKGNKSPWKFSDVNLLVCDECSLISVKSFSTLLNILLKKAALQQVILLGDVNQLPSIEPGNFLSDVYHTLEQNDCGITLRTNHRAESQLIVENARRNCQQEMPIFPDDCKKGFISLPYQSRKTKNGQESEGFRETEIVKDLLNNKISAVPSLEPHNSQFIAFRRLDCLKINELCSKHYNYHSLKTPKGKDDFRIGDKVCITKNMECFDAGTETEMKLCNGEIFFIENISVEKDNRGTKITYFVLDDGQKMVKVDIKSLKRAKLCHAWARTIHTFQGSEVDTIVYVLGSPSFQNWQHVYTAVTRGVRQVIMVYDPDHLRKVVTVSKPKERHTKLRELLSKEFKQASVSSSKEEGSGASVVGTSSDTSVTGDKSPQASEGRVFGSGAPPTPPKTSIQNLASSPKPHPTKSPRKRPCDKSQDTPAKGRRRSLTAKFDQICHLCKRLIKARVDEITPINNGPSTKWVHEGCA